MRRSVERVKADKGVNPEMIREVNVRSSGSGRCSSVKETESRRQSRKSNVRKDEAVQFKKKKTDITMFANASFNGGVFVNPVPGQSI